MSDGGALMNVTEGLYYKSQLSNTLLYGGIEKLTVYNLGKHSLNLCQNPASGMLEQGRREEGGREEEGRREGRQTDRQTG